VLHQGRLVTPDMLPPPLDRPFSSSPPSLAANNLPAPSHEDPLAVSNKTIRPLWLVEKEAIEQAIALCDGNIPKAAALLEVSPSTIYRKRSAWLEPE